jgi:lipoate-protein ligase A
MTTWHLLIDEKPGSGSWNMSVDEYLFQSLDEEGTTYLRFYAWRRPTVSLGYSQPVAQVVDVDYCRNNGIDIVRRVTGGKLVLHHDEVTYSVSSSDDKMFTSNLTDSYRLISEALVRGLEEMGIQACLAASTPESYSRSQVPCFTHPAKNEVEVDGQKIVGSAQKRVGKTFLQHGSIPLGEHEDLLRSVSLTPGKDEQISMTSLSQVLGKSVDFAWVVGHLIQGFAEYFGIGFRPKIFSPSEIEKITQIQRERHGRSDWVFRVS